MRETTTRKCAICRKAGNKLYLKGDRCHLEKCAMTKRNYPPGVHGASMRSRKTEYGRQLMEKQKVRKVYGIGESQFTAYVREAERRKGLAPSNLWDLLERRLDNIVYRCGFASSHGHARQMVSHGLMAVNGRKVDVPSYRVKKGDKIAFKIGTTKKGEVQQLIKKNLKDRSIPTWLSVDLKTGDTTVNSEPNYQDVEKDLSLLSVIEFYSRT